MTKDYVSTIILSDNEDYILVDKKTLFATAYALSLATLQLSRVTETPEDKTKEIIEKTAIEQTEKISDSIIDEWVQNTIKFELESPGFRLFTQPPDESV